MANCNFYAILLFVFLLPVSTAADVHLYDPAGVALNHFGASISELRLWADDPASSLGLLVGTPDYGGTSVTHGRVYFWFGGTELSLSPDLEVTGANNEKLGYAVARIGDVNNDGYDDFAAGAPTFSLTGANNGRVYVFYGGPSLDLVADAVLEGEPAATGYIGSQFGFSVWAAGDFNGDGDDDLIVGAPHANAPGLNQGAAFVYFGGGSGPSLTPDVTLTGEVGGDLFGWSVTGAGNFFGGNEDAVAVGAPSHSTQATEAGAVYVFKGSLPPFTPDDVYDLKLTNSAGNPAYGRFGFAVRSAHRWNTDAYDDLVIGAPNFLDGSPPTLTRGRVEIFFGGNPPDVNSDRQVDGEVNQDFFGYALVGVGDIRGTNYDDVLIGAPGQDGDGFNSGRAYVYEGNTSSSVTNAASLPTLPVTGVNPGAEPEDFYGAAVSAAGDFDSDGLADLVVGAPEGNIANNVVAGYVHLMDTSGTVTPTFLLDWSSAWTIDGRVHLEFTLSEPDEAFSWLTLSREILRDGESLAPPVTLFDGPAVPGNGELEIRDRTWIFEESPDALPVGSVLAYSLDLTLTDGRQIRLERLAGPAARPEALWPELLPPHPNPFNPQTEVTFRVPVGRDCVCRIVDMRGWHVATLYSGAATGQWQTVHWAGQADDGRTVPAGIYLVQLISGDLSQSRRIVLAK